MKYLLTFLILLSNASAQREIILPFGTDDWAFTRALDENNQQVDPSIADPDFWQTWLDQSLGNYSSPVIYDGPIFQANQQAPFYAGNVPGIQTGTSLDQPADATWKNGYFLKVIDGGELGYQNLGIRMLARDGAVVYLNGLPVTITPNFQALPYSEVVLSGPSDGATILDLPHIPGLSANRILRPGPNLLAIAAARAPEETDAFGLKVEITGEPGIPAITPILQNQIDSRLHLRWATAAPQKTLVKISNLDRGTTEIIESDSATRTHYFSREFDPGSRITYEILKPDLTLWEGNLTSGTIFIPSATIFTHEDTDWHFLQIRDGSGNDIDPSLSDPDFNQTWFTHTPPGFGDLPFTATPYDGPAFATTSTPIQYGDATGFPNFATELTPPTGGEGHTLWLLKTIDGGSEGFSELIFDVRVRDACFVYLNGTLISKSFWTPSEDTWIAHGNASALPRTEYFDDNNFGQPIFLNPGPNLLAVSVHSSELNLTSLGFSAELKAAKKPLPEIRDYEEDISDTTFKVSYLTGTPQSTLIHLGKNPQALEAYEIPGDRVFHQFELADLADSTTYYYEVLRGDGAPFSQPIVGQFTTPDISFVEKSASDWQVLHSLDSEGLGIDPALSDPDFNTTWMTLGMTNSAYDGPAFTPNQQAPFHISGGITGDGGTVLPNPGTDRRGAVYLVKEITGPPKGTLSLDFDITQNRAHRIYLNGKLIIDTLRVSQSGSAWDLYWENPTSQLSTIPAILVPGKNILAVSLHSFNKNDLSLSFDMALTGVAGTSDMIPLSDPVTNEFATSIQWFTATPSASNLRYGLSRNDMANTLYLPELTYLHDITLPHLAPGQRVYYEILKANGDSFSPPSINSFIAPKAPLISLKSDWLHLNPREPVSNVSIDPATLDPDFYQTWSTQSIGTFPGNSTYDGPTFAPSSPAPFGPAASNPGTQLTLPGAVWFLKEVDGGPTGYHQLSLFSNGNTAVTVFLNGDKIGEAYNQPTSQAIWSQFGGTLNRNSSIPLATNLILPPGPNLIAVQMHQTTFGQDTFDLSLSGIPLGASNTTPFTVTSTSTSADLTWATSQAQPTRLRWGLNLSSLTDSSEVLVDRNFHSLPLSNLTPSTTYFVETLDAAGNSHTPPTLASFRTEDQILVSRQSPDWSVLESISNGAFVDPALTDPDFLTTWFNPASYDGPAFTPNQSAPFATQGQHLRVGQTNLQTIANKIRPVWLLKEIDGGVNGYQSLTLDTTFNRGFAAYLNGQLIAAANLNNNDPFGSWNLSTRSSVLANSNLSIPIPDIFALNPGPNTLAIALHPIRFDYSGRLTGEFELRGAPRKLSISQPSLGAINFTNFNLNWTTSVPTTIRVNYGLDPLALNLAAETSALQTTHQITFPEFIEGGTYFYEIIATDALGNTANCTSSFVIYPQLMRRPFLQKAAPTSMTIKWRTRDPGTPLIRYGQNPTNLDQVIAGSSSPAPFTVTGRPDLDGIITDQTVTITDLTPATKYYYQIASENSPAPAEDLEQFFTTPPLPTTPAKTRIWVVGDSGQPGQGVLDVKDAYLQYTSETPTDLWLMLGDNAYNSGTDSEHQNGLFNIFPELLKNTPVWTTMGNHEGYSNQYYGIFDLPKQGESGGIPSGTEAYYSFDHGNIHFICLNSEEDPPGMIDWLKNDLQSTRSDWIIAFFHHGPYTKGSHDSDSEWKHGVSRGSYLPILEDYGVDLVLSGHSHQYERSHLLDGHYQKSDTYQLIDHAVDPGPGSDLGFTDRQTGIFQYTSEYGPYLKKIATPNSGHISATVGASSKLSRWSDTAGGDNFAITHPNPHPVHVSTIRALGSMIIDVDGHTLHASYLDSNGQIRDHFQINKSPEESPAITWWQQNFGAASYPYFADWLADADQDTNSNLAEFVHGGDPFQSEQLIEASLTTDGLDNDEPIQWFTVQYDLREGSQAVAESSQNLINFASTGIETRRLGPPNAQGIARWESRIRRTDQRTVFFRLKVSR